MKQRPRGTWKWPIDLVCCFFDCLAVNYGVLLLQALLEHWPETFSGIGDEGDQELPRADSPGLVTMPRFRS